MPTLYHWWRSSSSWRVRWALELKGVKADLVLVNLMTGENEQPAHLARNPMGYVPVLALDGRNMIESMAILEYLDETHPSPRLIPGDAYDRQHVRALSELINAGTQPIHNVDVFEHHSADPEEQKRWNAHFIRRGLKAFEKLASPRAGAFAFGNQVTAADLCLVPQCFAAARFGVDVAAEFPLVARWNAASLATPECQASHPDRYKP
ncbi:MAG: maleylacetoacetate isomerase [Deltaproteobacteria bacterium]|nr:maleylacetoacetate isomerase [Deltaproteobacteria bacterium]